VHEIRRQQQWRAGEGERETYVNLHDVGDEREEGHVSFCMKMMGTSLALD
jgi:hypothetical protein